jgi:NAD(P)-dependent dehydrogenase (short-subunit alcohol dehydrogenase family)
MICGPKAKLPGKIGSMSENLKMIISPTFLIFGSSGSIGSECVTTLQNTGRVLRGSRDISELKNQLNDIHEIDSVVWAQGLNLSDSVENFQLQNYENVIDANVTFILNSLRVLVEGNKLKHGSQLVIVSSVWGQISRPNKLTYGISKAAIGGLVRSLAADLGPLGIQINAVAPGPIDTPMTRKNLNARDLDRVISETPLKRLVSISEVTSLICKFANGNFKGVTGQEIVIDGGWSVSKLV